MTRLTLKAAALATFVLTACAAGGSTPVNEGDETGRGERPRSDAGARGDAATSSDAADNDETVVDVDPARDAEPADTRPQPDAQDASDTAVSDVSDEGDTTGDVGAADASDDTVIPDDTVVPDATTTFTPLDSYLDVPPGENEPCETPGSMSECSGIAVCRLYSVEQSRCESCETCGNLFDPCERSADCDILFTCYLGACTAMCSFETPQTCGDPDHCMRVGHPDYGVCLPL